MPRILLLISMLLLSCNLFAQAKFKQILLSDSEANFYLKYYLKSSCYKELIKFYEDGHDFSHLNISSDVQSLDKFEFTYGSDDPYFYHYTSKDITKHPEFKPLLSLLDKKTSYDDIIRLLRSLGKSDVFSIRYGYDKGFGHAGGVLYAASNPYSSMKYGDTQVRFEFAAHSQIYILTRNSYKKMNKLFKANPLHKSLVKKCGIDKLIFFILEDNDIDLIYYSSDIAFPKFDHTISYDFYNDLSSSQKLQYTFGEALGWFQILSMDKILNHQVTAKDD